MIIKKLLAALIAAILWTNMFAGTAYAADWGEGDTLEDALSELKVGFDDVLLEWLKLPDIGVVQQRYTYFYFKNERTSEVEEHPVYCIDPAKGGAYQIVAAVGPNSDGSDTATYIRGEKVGDPVYKGILSYGYPHMRLSTLGLETLEEGYYATKLALWMYILGNGPSQLTVNPAYGGDPVALRVRAAAIEIYNKGLTSLVPEPRITVTGKTATANLDADGQYYVQEIQINCSAWSSIDINRNSVQLSWDGTPPAGTVVLDASDGDITGSMSVSLEDRGDASGFWGSVTVKYPASEVDPDLDTPPTLKAEGLLANDDLYIAYAQAGQNEYQRYLIERDPKASITAALASQYARNPNVLTETDTGLMIRKVEAGTDMPLAGAVFDILNPEGQRIYSLATDDSGTVAIPLSVLGNYTVTEVTPPQYHLPSEVQTQSVTVRYGEVAEVTFTNAAYGSLRVVKRDAADGKPLADASVRIRNIATNATREGVTDSSGSAVFAKLPVGAYEIVEITAPPGYALDGSIHTVHVVSLSESETSYVLTNKSKPGLRITKFDRQTMTPVEGVTFEVWHDGEFMGTYVTDAWGKIELRDLPAGTYTAREIATVEPYVLDPTAQWVEISDGQGYISELVFLNLLKPGIRLVKVDSETLAPLPNVRFRVTQVGGSFSDEYITDIQGEIDLAHLAPGAYTVEELEAPEGYLMDDGIRTVQINPGENAQFVFTNTKKPSAEIIKLDSKTGARLAGATFRIAKTEDGSHYLDRVTDTDGRIIIDNLFPGVYSVSELAAPEGYVRDETEYHIELFPGKTSTLVVNNAHKPDLKIVKRDGTTGAPLAGAGFTVRQADSATLETVATDAAGEAWLYDLDPGVYEITEILAPEGYLLGNPPQLITLFPNRTGVAQFTNLKKPALTIRKYDEGTGLPLADAEFSVRHKDGSVIFEGMTDADGAITLENLDDGWYTVTEIAAPYGYLIANQPKDVYLKGGEHVTVKFDNRLRPALKLIKVDEQTKQPLAGAKFRVWKTEDETTSEYITGADGTVTVPHLDEAIYSIEEISAPEGYILNPQHKDIELEWGKTKELVYTNQKKPTLTVVKYDELTNQPLAGANFRLWRTEGETWSETQITGADGKYTWTDLDPGTYSIEETDEPYGYFKDGSRKEILLGGDDNKQLEFFNRPRPVLRILKRDAVTGEPLPDVKFRIQRAEGETVGEFLTDADGKIELSPATGYLLEEAVYTVTEITPPNEYLLSEYPIQSVQLKWYEPTELIFENLLKPTLIFMKTNALTGRGISDATYRVDYESPAGGVTSLGTYKTKCGLIVLPYVLPGWYSLTETIPAPGYSLPTNPAQRLHLAPGENSYTYGQTHEDLYADPRTNPMNGERGACGDWCGYLCSTLCAGNCGSAGGGNMSGGTGGAFGGMTVTNGKGDPLGTASAAPSDTTAPVLTAGTATRISDGRAEVRFQSGEAGRYYYALVQDGANESIVSTSGLGTVCGTNMTTVTVYLTVGAKDIYIKVKDAVGNVSAALKMDIPAYAPPAPSASPAPAQASPSPSVQTTSAQAESTPTPTPSPTQSPSPASAQASPSTQAEPTPPPAPSPASTEPTSIPSPTAPPIPGGVIFIHPDFAGITIRFGSLR
jgi:5-hydroxyisourate hydrolase-like protein (transthyretin family)